RYLPLLKARGAAAVIVYSHRVLVKILLTMTSMVVDADHGVSVDAFDCHCSMLSLPYLFKTTVDTIPAEVPYLRLPPKAGERWAKALASRPGLKVGLTWAGSRHTARDRLRSVPLQEFAPLMAVPGVQFVVLQKDDESREQMRALDWPMIDWMDECDDLLDTAALVDQLDLVISVDTVIVHMAGALGKPVWLLNRYESEWRWLTEGETSPWYPSMRIFRQAAMHDWHSVIAGVAKELCKLSATREEKRLDGGLIARVKKWFA
ncbi:MAG: hypothetical protein JO002_08700, partial [Burkholderiaceae bacterium]|nr:hypothetical protein [Burkholderiaceae bacterium]